MRSLSAAWPTVARTIEKRDYALMLDFDGVLSEIVKNPDRAQISPVAKKYLTTIASRHRVAIISGRSLRDVRTRAGIRGIGYVGNHGAEWFFQHTHGRYRPSESEQHDLQTLKKRCRELVHEYPGCHVEYKKLSISIHFRAVSKKSTENLHRTLIRLLKTYAKHIRCDKGFEYVYNICLRNAPTKGTAARLFLRNCPRGAIPIFIGDDTTDEDAFRALKTGITIFVGRRRKSGARYHIVSRRGVDVFLKRLALIS